MTTLNFSGQRNGGYELSSHGVTTETYGGTTSKYNSQSDNWSIDITGIVGPETGDFDAMALSKRNTNRQRVK